jgi:hypothetical protein
MDFGSLGEAAPSQIVEKYEPDKCFVVGANLQSICVPYDLVLGRGCAEVVASSTGITVVLKVFRRKRL